MLPNTKNRSISSRVLLVIMGGLILSIFISICLFEYLYTNGYFKLVFVAVLSSIGIIILPITYFILKKNIYSPLLQINEFFKQLSTGNLDTSILNDTPFELGEVTNQLIVLSENNYKAAAFAKEMGEGNFSSEYIPMNEFDVLGNSLLEMRKNMLKVAEDEKKRSWINEGMAKFGELLRTDTQDISKFSDSILTNLIKYLDANQGAFYVLNDESKNNEFLYQTATYAWGRKKYQENNIKIGEGLLGQAVLEKETIFLTDIPQGYVQITSGLGHSTPNCVIILPLIYNEEVFGVIEMASFNIFEAYQMEFLNKVCMGIASAISNVKVNERTNKLLNDSINQSKELKEKDGLMRQQVEELRATQEEMEHKDLEKKQIELKTNSILEGCVECIVAFNHEGVIEFFNKAAQDIWHISRENAIGTNITKFLPIELIKNENDCITTIGIGKDKKTLNGKTEINIKDLKGEELTILCSISTTKIDGECFFTAFIQNLTVDLF